MKPSRYSQVVSIIGYLVNATPTERSYEDISFGTQISYQMVRRHVREYYPHCFKYVDGVGWFLTGIQPVPELPLDFDSLKVRHADKVPTHHVVVDSKVFQHGAAPHEREPVQPSRSGSGWVYNQSALRFLDTLFPGKTFAQALEAASEKEGGLKELEVLGKTMSKAAIDFSKTGKVPF